MAASAPSSAPLTAHAARPPAVSAARRLGIEFHDGWSFVPHCGPTGYKPVSAHVFFYLPGSSEHVRARVNPGEDDRLPPGRHTELTAFAPATPDVRPRPANSNVRVTPALLVATLEASFQALGVDLGGRTYDQYHEYHQYQYLQQRLAARARGRVEPEVLEGLDLVFSKRRGERDGARRITHLTVGLRVRRGYVRGPGPREPVNV